MTETHQIDLLKGLNTHQAEAVSASLQHHLILAGAGSGKTRVLVHRLAYLISTMGVSPFAILAVTFTNKAAKEMLGRAEKILNRPLQGFWIGTFHGICHRLLRRHWQEARLPQNFQILDSDDQLRMVRSIHKTMGLDDKKWLPKSSQSFINTHKEQGLRASQVDRDSNPHAAKLAEIYKAYEDGCQRSGLVDFAELLLRCCEMLEQDPATRAHYQNRFEHILIDEFQDTNNLQYRWLQLLAGERGIMMAVGDDDQSIYSWRGARVEHMLNFTNDYPNVKTIRLEQNYRSTSTILSAANAVISNNTDRLGKDLWTEGSSGTPIMIYAAYNEVDEARFLIQKARNWVESDPRNNYDGVAILYRSNAQSRVIEEQLTRARIPYRVYGGLRFFERMEIKDTLGYLRMIALPFDDAAFERIVNLPTRGVGQSTLAILRDHARSRDISLRQASTELIQNEALPGRAAKALQGFIDLITTLRADAEDMEIGALAEHVIKVSGLYAHYQKEQGETGRARLENLAELVGAMKLYNIPEETDEARTPLLTFLASVCLDAGEGQAEEDQAAVSLMTLHAAKGLEYPLVLLTGMEEGLFPSARSMEAPGKLEEERRLCYVGMTRAMQQLVMTYAEARRLYGREHFHKPSRFIAEIPPEYVSGVKLNASLNRLSPAAKPARSRQNYPPKQASGYHTTTQRQAPRTQIPSHQVAHTAGSNEPALGQTVRHAHFGEGVVLAYEGDGAHRRVQVRFHSQGAKWLMLSLAKLEAA